MIHSANLSIISQTIYHTYEYSQRPPHICYQITQSIKLFYIAFLYNLPAKKFTYFTLFSIKSSLSSSSET